MKAFCLSLLLLATETVGGPPEATIYKCSMYDCDPSHTYDWGNGQTTNVECAPKSGGWFYKTVGTLELNLPSYGEFMLGICQLNGYDAVGDVYQAGPPGAKPLPDKDTKCNKRYWVDMWAEGSNPNKKMEKDFLHYTWLCVNYPKPNAPAECCDRSKWVEGCVAGRYPINNFHNCVVPDGAGEVVCFIECASGIWSSDECYECCQASRSWQWNCDATQEPTKTPSDNPTKSPTRSPIDQTDAPSRTPTASPSRDPTASPSRDPTASPSRNPTASPIRDPTASPSRDPTASPSRNPTASPVDSGSPTSSPTEFDKVTAELFCRAAKTKKDCKKGLTKIQGKCKWKSGKKGSNNGVCKLKTYNAPVNCGTLTKRQCKTAIKKGNCVAADVKGHTCRSKVVE